MTKNESMIPVTMLHEMFTVTDVGLLFWKERPLNHFSGTAKRTQSHVCANWNARYAGKEALACKTPLGHKIGRINDKLIHSHRVVWAMNTGHWPEHEIDHINGATHDNRISNLRDVTHKQNLRNQAIRKNNSSGQNGVSFYKRDKVWSASINKDGKKHHLGYFKTKDGAIMARQLANESQGFHKNHGRSAA